METVNTDKAVDWNRIPDKTTIENVMNGLRKRNFNPVYAEHKMQAFEKLNGMIPAGADITTGSSATLSEIGFMDYLAKRKHPWNNWKDKIFAENDPEKQADLRRISTTASYFAAACRP